MKEGTAINSLLDIIPVTKPVGFYDVYSPQKQQAFDLNNQRIRQNNFNYEQSLIKAQRQEQDFQREYELRQDLEDHYETRQENFEYQDTTDLDRTLYQTNLGIADIYAQNGFPQKAMDIRNNALSTRLKQANFEQQQDTRALGQLIGASNTGTGSVVDLANNYYSDFLEENNSSGVTARQPLRGRGGGSGGSKPEKTSVYTLITPEGNQVVDLTERQAIEMKNKGSSIYSEKDFASKYKDYTKQFELRANGTPMDETDFRRSLLSQPPIQNPNTGTGGGTAKNNPTAGVTVVPFKRN